MLFRFLQLSGIGLVVAGTVIQIKYSQYINFLGDDFLSAPIVLIACGCVITLLGFFGCCGAIRENYCMTMTVSAFWPVADISVSSSPAPRSPGAARPLELKLLLASRCRCDCVSQRECGDGDTAAPSVSQPRRPLQIGTRPPI